MNGIVGLKAPRASAERVRSGTSDEAAIRHIEEARTRLDGVLQALIDRLPFGEDRGALASVRNRDVQLVRFVHGAHIEWEVAFHMHGIVSCRSDANYAHEQSPVLWTATTWASGMQKLLAMLISQAEADVNNGSVRLACLKNADFRVNLVP